nr:reverse transcriptase domain-containing protein [Tanacetum cinerariifolium]
MSEVDLCRELHFIQLVCRDLPLEVLRHNGYAVLEKKIGYAVPNGSGYAVIDLERCECFESKAGDDSDSRKPIRCIDSVNTPYLVAQETTRPDKIKIEHLYMASANKIDEKKPELKKFPHHLEYAYLEFVGQPYSLVQKKGGMNVVLNENNELIPFRTVTRWRISIVPEDQEKKTFNCPYGTFAYRRMPFGLCNVPATFQRCLTAIFHDMVEDFIEVSMDDFLVFAVDYASKWVEAQALPTNDARVVIKFLRRLFARFGAHKALISDQGTHFCNSQLEKALQKYGVTHKLSTSYHPQTNGKTKVTNRAIKRILERLVVYNLKNWSERLEDALWAFRTTYKTPTGCTPFRLAYGKACHLHVEIEHGAYWALKQCNMNLTTVAKTHFMELNELMKLRDGSYENTRIYKKRTKKWHESRLRGDKNFKVGDKVLLFNSRFKMHPGKLKSKWYDPNMVKTLYLYGTVEITDKNRISFKVNGQRLKKYYDGNIDTNEREVVKFEENLT